MEALVADYLTSYPLTLEEVSYRGEYPVLRILEASLVVEGDTVVFD